MAKFDVSAVVASSFNTWALLVSVQGQDGNGVTGLTKENFIAARYASKNQIGWSELEVVAAQTGRHGRRGRYYTLQLKEPNGPTFQQAFDSSTELVMTVAVHSPDGPGQSLVWCPFACCLDPKLHPHER